MAGRVKRRLSRSAQDYFQNVSYAKLRCVNFVCEAIPMDRVPDADPTVREREALIRKLEKDLARFQRIPDKRREAECADEGEATCRALLAELRPGNQAKPTPCVQALAFFLDVAAELRDPWWIIGGAATALIIDNDADVQDIDLLLSPADARRLITILGLPDSTDGGTERFRSEVYATWRVPPVPIDLLGGFQVKVSDHWTPVAPKTRQPFQTPAGTIFLPSVEEQIEITERLGRPRDFERINLLTLL